MLDVNGGLLVRGYRAVSNQGAHLQWNRTGGDGETWLLNQRGGGTANAGIRFGDVTTGDVVTEYARFLYNGYLGLGTTAPVARFQVQPAGDADRGVQVGDNSSAGNLVLQPLTGANAGFGFIGFNGYYNGGEQRINTNKNRWRVGVDQRGSTDNLFIDTFNGTTGITALTITPAGYVGLGTRSPSQPLEVAGTVYSNTGGFKFPDGTTQTTAAVTATGASFIQNQTAQQASSNFNISGNGTIGGNAAVAGQLTIGGPVSGYSTPLNITPNANTNNYISFGNSTATASYFSLQSIGNGTALAFVDNYSSYTYPARIVITSSLSSNGNSAGGVGINALPGTGLALDVNGNARTTNFSTQVALASQLQVGYPAANGNYPPNSTVALFGTVAANIRSLSSGTLAETDYTVVVTGNVSLPAPSQTNYGRIYHLINGNTASNTVTGTLRDAGSSATTSSFTLTPAAGSKGITVQSDNAQWWIISSE